MWAVHGRAHSGSGSRTGTKSPGDRGDTKRMSRRSVTLLRMTYSMPGPNASCTSHYHVGVDGGPLRLVRGERVGGRQREGAPGVQDAVAALGLAGAAQHPLGFAVVQLHLDGVCGAADLPGLAAGRGDGRGRRRRWWKEDLHVCPDKASWLMQGLQRERHAQTNQKPEERHKTPNSTM